MKDENQNQEKIRKERELNKALATLLEHSQVRHVAKRIAELVLARDRLRDESEMDCRNEQLKQLDFKIHAMARLHESEAFNKGLRKQLHEKNIHVPEKIPPSQNPPFVGSFVPPPNRPYSSTAPSTTAETTEAQSSPHFKVPAIPPHRIGNGTMPGPRHDLPGPSSSNTVVQQSQLQQQQRPIKQRGRKYLNGAGGPARIHGANEAAAGGAAMAAQQHVTPMERQIVNGQQQEQPLQQRSPPVPIAGPHLQPTPVFQAQAQQALEQVLQQQTQRVQRFEEELQELQQQGLPLHEKQQELHFAMLNLRKVKDMLDPQKEMERQKKESEKTLLLIRQQQLRMANGQPPQPGSTAGGASDTPALASPVPSTPSTPQPNQAMLEKDPNYIARQQAAALRARKEPFITYKAAATHVADPSDLANWNNYVAQRKAEAVRAKIHEGAAASVANPSGLANGPQKGTNYAALQKAEAIRAKIQEGAAAYVADPSLLANGLQITQQQLQQPMVGSVPQPPANGGTLTGLTPASVASPSPSTSKGVHYTQQPSHSAQQHLQLPPNHVAQPMDAATLARMQVGAVAGSSTTLTPGAARYKQLTSLLSPEKMQHRIDQRTFTEEQHQQQPAIGRVPQTHIQQILANGGHSSSNLSLPLSSPASSTMTSAPSTPQHLQSMLQQTPPGYHAQLEAAATAGRTLLDMTGAGFSGMAALATQAATPNGLQSTHSTMLPGQAGEQLPMMLLKNSSDQQHQMQQQPAIGDVNHFAQPPSNGVAFSVPSSANLSLGMGTPVAHASMPLPTMNSVPSSLQRGELMQQQITLDNRVQLEEAAIAGRTLLGSSALGGSFAGLATPSAGPSHGLQSPGDILKSAQRGMDPEQFKKMMMEVQKTSAQLQQSASDNATQNNESDLRIQQASTAAVAVSSGFATPLVPAAPSNDQQLGLRTPHEINQMIQKSDAVESQLRQQMHPAPVATVQMQPRLASAAPGAATPAAAAALPPGIDAATLALVRTDIDQAARILGTAQLGLYLDYLLASGQFSS